MLYGVATGKVRVQGTLGQMIFSWAFNVRRGVVQGDIISPVLFIIALDRIMQDYDRRATGVKCGALTLSTFGYADDVALVERIVRQMTRRLTDIGDASETEADMKIRMDKTFSQHAKKQEAVTVTKEEIKKSTRQAGI